MTDKVVDLSATCWKNKRPEIVLHTHCCLVKIYIICQEGGKGPRVHRVQGGECLENKFGFADARTHVKMRWSLIGFPKFCSSPCLAPHFWHNFSHFRHCFLTLRNRWCVPPPCSSKLLEVGVTGQLSVGGAGEWQNLRENNNVIYLAARILSLQFFYYNNFQSCFSSWPPAIHPFWGYLRKQNTLLIWGNSTFSLVFTASTNSASQFCFVF